jgi:hypothetical protein
VVAETLRREEGHAAPAAGRIFVSGASLMMTILAPQLEVLNRILVEPAPIVSPN